METRRWKRAFLPLSCAFVRLLERVWYSRAPLRLFKKKSEGTSYVSCLFTSGDETLNLFIGFSLFVHKKLNALYKIQLPRKANTNKHTRTNRQTS